MIIHGGIDGNSRLITFLRAADNNSSTTVLHSFLRAAYQYDAPSRVRCDHGGRNILVGMFMVRYRGCNRGSIFTGRSVHNRRIQRLWVDVFTGWTYSLGVLLYIMNCFTPWRTVICFMLKTNGICLACTIFSTSIQS